MQSSPSSSLLKVSGKLLAYRKHPLQMPRQVPALGFYLQKNILCPWLLVLDLGLAWQIAVPAGWNKNLIGYKLCLSGHPWKAPITVIIQKSFSHLTLSSCEIFVNFELIIIYCKMKLLWTLGTLSFIFHIAKIMMKLSPFEK